MITFVVAGATITNQFQSCWNATKAQRHAHQGIFFFLKVRFKVYHGASAYTWYM
jgi:hypothetical protein